MFDTDSNNARLAAFICEFDEKDLSAHARHHATRAVLDTYAVTVAGAVEAGVRQLAQALPALPEAGANATVGGRSYRADDAALLIGTASHVLDYDDVSMICVCHPSAPVLSAMTAAVAFGVVDKPVSGLAFLTALCVGTEVMIRTGQTMGFRHYELGFHPTSTMGVLGATAAVARLGGLNTTQTAHALSIAASMASGLRTNFGTMVKSLHVGLAAANALRAVQLARAGMDGASDVFAQRGLLFGFSGAETDAWPDEVRLGQPFVIEEPGFEQKRYPCCYMLHKIIEASVALQREHDLKLEQLDTALVSLPVGGTRPLNHPYPLTGLHGKFSAPYAVLASVADGRVNLSSFLDESVLRTEIQAKLRDVEVIEEGTASNAGSDLGNGPVTVSLNLRDGRTLSRTVTLAPGSPADPITAEQLRGKWIDCFGHGKPQLGDARAAALFEQGEQMDQMASVQSWLSEVLR